MHWIINAKAESCPATDVRLLKCVIALGASFKVYDLLLVCDLDVFSFMRF